MWGQDLVPWVGGKKFWPLSSKAERCLGGWASILEQELAPFLPLAVWDFRSQPLGLLLLSALCKALPAPLLFPVSRLS